MKEKKQSTNKYVRYIVGFSFGKGSNNSPGPTNNGLAYSIYKIVLSYIKHNKPFPKLLLQEELAKSLLKQFNLPTDVIIKRKHTHRYLDTREVATQAAMHVKSKDKKVLVVAHPDHIARCITELNSLGISAIKSTFFYRINIPWHTYKCNANGYSKKSTQPWTRTRKQFLAHEKTLKNIKI